MCDFKQQNACFLRPSLVFFSCRVPEKSTTKVVLEVWTRRLQKHSTPGSQLRKKANLRVSKHAVICLIYMHKHEGRSLVFIIRKFLASTSMLHIFNSLFKMIHKEQHVSTSTVTLITLENIEDLLLKACIPASDW